jgi:hypothetical protein
VGGGGGGDLRKVNGIRSPVSSVTSCPANHEDLIRLTHICAKEPSSESESEPVAPPAAVWFRTKMKSILFSGLQGG